jgi:hypothetical protein
LITHQAISRDAVVGQLGSDPWPIVWMFQSRPVAGFSNTIFIVPMKDIDSLRLAPPLKIAVAYLDSITREWAVQFCERAKNRCGDGGIRWAYWKFDLLSDVEIMEQAVASATESNLIILTTYACTELPREVKDWLRTCLPQRRGEQRALVGLLGKARISTSRPSSAAEYLAAAAEAAQVDYYLREFTLQTELPDLSIERIAERANTTTGLLSEILSHTYPHPRITQSELANSHPTESASAGPFVVELGEEDEGW